MDLNELLFRAACFCRRTQHQRKRDFTAVSQVLCLSHSHVHMSGMFVKMHEKLLFTGRQTKGVEVTKCTRVHGRELRFIAAPAGTDSTSSSAFWPKTFLRQLSPIKTAAGSGSCRLVYMHATLLHYLQCESIAYVCNYCIAITRATTAIAHHPAHSRRRHS